MLSRPTAWTRADPQVFLNSLSQSGSALLPQSFSGSGKSVYAFQLPLAAGRRLAQQSPEAQHQFFEGMALDFRAAFQPELRGLLGVTTLPYGVTVLCTDDVAGVALRQRMREVRVVPSTHARLMGESVQLTLTEQPLSLPPHSCKIVVRNLPYDCMRVGLGAGLLHAAGVDPLLARLVFEQLGAPKIDWGVPCFDVAVLHVDCSDIPRLLSLLPETFMLGDRTVRLHVQFNEVGAAPGSPAQAAGLGATPAPSWVPAPTERVDAQVEAEVPPTRPTPTTGAAAPPAPTGTTAPVQAGPAAVMEPPIAGSGPSGSAPGRVLPRSMRPASPRQGSVPGPSPADVSVSDAAALSDQPTSQSQQAAPAVSRGGTPASPEAQLRRWISSRRSGGPPPSPSLSPLPQAPPSAPPPPPPPGPSPSQQRRQLQQQHQQRQHQQHQQEHQRGGALQPPTPCSHRRISRGGMPAPKRLRGTATPPSPHGDSGSSSDASTSDSGDVAPPGLHDAVRRGMAAWKARARQAMTGGLQNWSEVFDLGRHSKGAMPRRADLGPLAEAVGALLQEEELTRVPEGWSTFLQTDPAAREYFILELHQRFQAAWALARGASSQQAIYKPLRRAFLRCAANFTTCLHALAPEADDAPRMVRRSARQGAAPP